MHGNSIKYTDTHTFISLRFYFISKTNFVKVCSNVNNNKYEKQNNSPFFLKKYLYIYHNCINIHSINLDGLEIISQLYKQGEKQITVW